MNCRDSGLGIRDSENSGGTTMTDRREFVQTLGAAAAAYLLHPRAPNPNPLVPSKIEPVEGKLPYDVLLAETDPKLVQMEMDLYWITKGGQDPLAYFARWPGRFPLVHVKDSMGPPDNKMADVGAGTINWKHIFAQQSQAGIKHFFVEHDQPADAFASIKASCDYLKRLEF